MLCNLHALRCLQVVADVHAMRHARSGKNRVAGEVHIDYCV